MERKRMDLRKSLEVQSKRGYDHENERRILHAMSPSITKFLIAQAQKDVS